MPAFEAEAARLPAAAGVEHLNLDAGAGEQRFRPACAHLKYVAQDFGEYDGRGDGSALQTRRWDQAKLDIVSDITAIPEPDGAFDAVLCISTLEHIGMANDQYVSEAAADDPEGDAHALRELGRVTRTAGKVLVTVPAGRAEQLGWLRQYSPRSWEELVAGSGLRATETAYYALDPQGRWRAVAAGDLEGVAYDRVRQHARGVICASLTPVGPS